MNKKENLDRQDVVIEQREPLYNGFFSMEKLTLRHRLFKGGWSPLLQRELFIRGTAVACVIYDPQHRLIGLVEQFRVGLLEDENSPWCREVVAGMKEEGETDKDVILRELQEEAGIIPEALHNICDYYTSPGGTSERLTLFCAVADLSRAGGYYGLEEEGEDIRMIVLPEKEVFEALYDGQYNNAATLICLQWLQMNRLSGVFSDDAID